MLLISDKIKIDFIITYSNLIYIKCFLDTNRDNTQCLLVNNSIQKDFLLWKYLLQDQRLL